MNEIKKKILKKIDKEIKIVNYGTMIFGTGLFIAIVATLIATFGAVKDPVSDGIVTSGLVALLGNMSVGIITGILITIGLVVGSINITKKETVAFLISSVVLIMLIGPFMANFIQVFGIDSVGRFFVGELFKNIIGLVVPAALVVSLKTLFTTAKDEE